MNRRAPPDRDAVAEFVEGLAETPCAGLFNPWFEHDRENDAAERSSDIRRRQLVHYLAARRGRARYVLIAEAAGYQGAHFSGIAMTSERILLGWLRQRGISPRHVLPGLEPRRTSKASVREKGFTEPTATIVWSALSELGVAPLDFALWNAVPWHPYRPDKGMLSNRTPTPRELDASRRHLENFLALYPTARLIAVGRKSETALSGRGALPVRHPANGGAAGFRAGMARILQSA